MLFRHEAVIVIWLDAHAKNQAVEYAESEVDQVHKAEEIATLGLLLKRDDVGVTLYNENTGPDSVRGLSFIPAGMIKDIIPLGHLKPKKARNKKSPTPI